MPSKKGVAKSTSKAWKYRTSLRLPGRAAVMADTVKDKLGVGDRMEVIRKATMYGLEAFARNPSLVRRVDDKER